MTAASLWAFGFWFGIVLPAGFLTLLVAGRHLGRVSRHYPEGGN